MDQEQFYTITVAATPEQATKTTEMQNKINRLLRAGIASLPKEQRIWLDGLIDELPDDRHSLIDLDNID